MDVSGKPYTLSFMLYSSDRLTNYSSFLIGNVYIGDYSNHRIRKMTASSGLIDTIAGTGAAGYSGDNGQATAALINFPHGVNLDASFNVYFGDVRGCNVIRKITVSTGIISTVAGTGSTSGGYNGDNIQATAAMLNHPADIILDSFGNLFICDGGNNRVRKVDMSTGVITTIIGTGISSSTGDGSASTAATVTSPWFNRFDSAGNHYITEITGNRVRKVTIVTTDIPTSAPSVTPIYNPSEIPSSQPTSQPTSHPTKLNIIASNFLDTPLTARVVQEKTNYYLASYLGYFLTLYICLYLFSFTKIGKPVVRSLYHSSYNSQFYYSFCNQNRDPTTAYVPILSDIYKKMSRVMEAIHLEKVTHLLTYSLTLLLTYSLSGVTNDWILLSRLPG